MSMICPRYAQDMPNICPRYAKDTLKIWPRYAQQSSKIVTLGLPLYTKGKVPSAVPVQFFGLKMPSMTWGNISSVDLDPFWGPEVVQN